MKELNDILKIELEDILSMYKVINSTTMKSFVDALKRFFQNESQVFLITIDMREISTDVVNHIRLLMDESNYQYRKYASTSKIMILLLHFPSSNFFKHCYPTVFAQGWRHYYLDSFGYGKKAGTINVTEWLLQSFELSSPSLHFITDDDMEAWLREMLPVISSYIELENLKPILLDRHQIWKEILFSHGIKSVLFMHFKNLWKQETMMNMSKKMAALSARFVSTLGISDLVNSAVKSTFMDLVLYVLSIANKYRVIHTLAHKQYNEETISVAIEIMKSIQIPSSFDALKTELMVFILPSFKVKSNQRIPSFPFFHLIHKTIEQVLHRCSNEICIENSIENVGDQTEIFLMKNTNRSLIKGGNYCDRMTALLQTQLKKEVCIVAFSITI